MGYPFTLCRINNHSLYPYFRKHKNHYYFSFVDISSRDMLPHRDTKTVLSICISTCIFYDHYDGGCRLRTFMSLAFSTFDIVCISQLSPYTFYGTHRKSSEIFAYTFPYFLKLDLCKLVLY